MPATGSCKDHRWTLDGICRMLRLAEGSAILFFAVSLLSFDLPLTMPFQAVGQIAHHAARALHGFEGAAMVKRQATSTLAPTTAAVPTTLVVSNEGGVTTLSLTDTGDAQQAISTLLSAYSSADQTLASANSAAVQSFSDFIRAQESINSVLSAGGTPIIAGNTPVTVTPVSRPTSGVAPTGVVPSRNSTSLAPSSSTAASSSQAPTGAASHTVHAKLGLIGLMGLAASYVAFAV